MFHVWAHKLKHNICRLVFFGIFFFFGKDSKIITYPSVGKLRFICFFFLLLSFFFFQHVTTSLNKKKNNIHRKKIEVGKMFPSRWGFPQQVVRPPSPKHPSVFTDRIRSYTTSGVFRLFTVFCFILFLFCERVCVAKVFHNVCVVVFRCWDGSREEEKEKMMGLSRFFFLLSQWEKEELFQQGPNSPGWRQLFPICVSVVYYTVNYSIYVGKAYSWTVHRIQVPVGRLIPWSMCELFSFFLCHHLLTPSF